MNDRQEVFPVGLLARGKRCKVFGGGKVATRKCGSLLEAGACVVVVSPELTDVLRASVEAGQLRWERRCYEEADLDGSFLVFAATSSPEVNRAILDASRARGVYACSVDGSWVDGAFVSLATFRKGGLTVSVSTGGRSCRRSRMVKESVARHVDIVDDTGILVMGTSHNYLSVDEREPFHLTGRRFEEVGEMVAHVWGVQEFALLNTCNRIELIAVVTRSDAVEQLLACILGFNRLGDGEFYSKWDRDAFSHMAVLTAGLLSQTPGENHIVAQVKDAVSGAVERGWGSAMLQQWLSQILHLSKHIRNETAPHLHHQEIEDLTLSFLAPCVQRWPEAHVMVVGAGVIGSNLVANLVTCGCTVTWCYHRHRPELEAGMAEQVRLESMNGIRECLPQADVVICATSSEGHVLHMGHAPFFDQERETLVVDLAMPRNVEPALNGLGDAIRVVDLDDLKHRFRRERADMARIFEISTQVVAGHEELYAKLCEAFPNQGEER